jgi:predicted RNA-binding protein (virulence factor B family)
MAEIGRLNVLKVVKEVEFGIYLDGGELGEILLPRRYVPRNCKTGDNLEVFIYVDSEDRIIATTEKPYAMVGDFALLKVVSVNNVGAFLDWGLPKDLLVPFSEQDRKMEEGRAYIVKIYLDEKTRRIAASSRLDNYLEQEPGDLQEGQEVELLIRHRTPIGHIAIINSLHHGVLHHNEVFQTLNRGQKIKGFIKKIRDDHKIDLCLHQPGYGKVADVTETILDTLKKEGGFLSITDKTSPEVIYNWFGVSKKTYKKAIGAIYKRRLIIIEDTGIKLNEENRGE